MTDLLHARLAAARRAVADAPVSGIKPRTTSDIPLSSAQSRMWFAWRLDPTSAAYNVPVVLRLNGRLDPDALTRAVQNLVDRHEVLRTVFRQRDGEPVAELRDAHAVPVRVADLPATQLDAALDAEIHQPFDLEARPPTRVALFRTGPDEHTLAMTFHHIAMDGESEATLLSDLAVGYARNLGGEALRPLGPSTLQYADVVDWEAGRSDDRAAPDLAWWERRLAGLQPQLDLPTDRPRPEVAGSEGGFVEVTIPPELTARVRRLAAESAASPFMVLLTAWQALLGRLAGTPDVAVGVPHAGRHHPDMAGVVGCFVNSLVVRTDLSGDPSGRELLGRVRGEVLDMLGHARTPFDKLVERLAPQRDASSTPVFQAMLNVLEGAAGEARWPGLTAVPVRIQTRTAKLDLSLGLIGDADSYRGELVFRTDLFDTGTARRMVAWYVAVLSGMVADPDAPVLGHALEPLTPAAVGPALADLPERPVHELIEAQADRTPTATAVEAEDGSLTYAELERRANRIAHLLRDGGVRAEEPVGVLLEPGVDFVAAVLGVMKAGAAFLPFDAAFPAARITAALGTTGAGFVLTHRELSDKITGSGLTTLLLDDPDTLASRPESRVGVEVEPHQLAYVICTSGSTGSPKAVAVEHRQAATFAAGALSRYGDTSGHSFAVLSTVAADLQLTCFFGALLSGGALHLVGRDTAMNPAAMASRLAEQPVDVFKCTPSHLELLAAEGHLASVLPRRLLMLGGESCSWDLVERVRRVAPGLRVHTTYGPTETTVSVFVCDTDEVPESARVGAVPLGRPLPGVVCSVVDAAGRALPAGVPGELVIGGPQVARGYLGDGVRTAERFVDDPLGSASRCYRTGDVVRVGADGTVDFLGRADDQVKVRGHRIELGEVAAALRGVPTVADAVVLPVGEGHLRHLAAWLVPELGTALDVDAVRAALRRALPGYMVPASMLVLDRFPLQANGKIDRDALPASTAAAPSAGRSAPPTTATEKHVARIWSDVLTLSDVGVDDDFFALGGHSFAATRAVSRLADALGQDVPVRLLFEWPTVAGLAGELDRRAASATSHGLPPLTRRPDPDAPIPLSSVQVRMWFLAQLEPDDPSYNVDMTLHLSGRLDAQALLAAVRDLAERHEVLRTVIHDRDGEPVAELLPPEAVVTAFEDLGENGGREAAAGRVRENLTRPFDLGSETPARAVLLRLGAEEHILSLMFHHIATDHWSRGLIASELAACYAARVGATGAPASRRLQYADVVAWEAEHHDERSEEDLDWWVSRLGGLAPLEIPTDRPRPAVAGTAGAAVPVVLPLRLVERVRSAAAETGCTPFMVLLACWQVLLGRLAGVDDVAVGVPHSGRPHPDAESVVGCFVNTLVLRTQLSGDPSGRELLHRVRGTVLDAFAHARTPFEHLVERLAPDRSAAASPVFQAMLNVLDGSAAAPSLPGLRAGYLDQPAATAKADLSLSLVARPGGAGASAGYAGDLCYRTDLFDERTAERVARWFVTSLDGMLTDLDAPAVAVALEPASGPTLRGPSAAPRADEPLHLAMERWADRTPEAVAVVAQDEVLSYAELESRANRIAFRLGALGVRPDEPVAVLTSTGATLVSAMFGILKAGGAYTPLDTVFPAPRIAEMLATAGARVVLTQRDQVDRLPQTVTAVVLDEPEALAGCSDNRPAPAVGPGNLIHVIFTSGSTGRPKAVAAEHRNVVNNLGGVLERFDVGPGASFAMVSTPAADFGLACVYGALTTGGTVHLIDRDTAMDPEGLSRYLARHQVDVLKCVPSHLELLAGGEDLASVLPRRLLVLAGEACAWTLVERVRAARPDLRVQSHYGHTESTMISMTCEVDRVPAQSRGAVVPLGEPLPGVVGYLVDRAGRPVPPGVPGELVVGGAGVSRGYLGDPELTAARFVPDPVDGSVRCYRSGDLLRLRADGTVEFLGRLDDQVKVRGHRVELGEVLAALRALPEVSDAVVLPVGSGHLRALAAWVVPAAVAASAAGEGSSALDTARIRAALRERLPDYMVPATLTALDRVPLNPNGKLDREALPEPLEDRSGAGSAPPSTSTERLVARAWADVLGVDQVGADDDFFALGGHSLLAVRAVRAIGSGLRVIDLFLHPTVRALARRLDDAPQGAGASAPANGLLHRLSPPGAVTGTETVSLICVPYGGGSAAVYAPLAQALGADAGLPAVEVLAVELPGHDPARPDERPLPLAEVVDRLAEQIEAEVTGPVAVYGHCVGSALAAALTRRLEADGVRVVGVVAAGSLPTARFSGRLAGWFDRTFPRDRWESDRFTRDALRATGGLPEDVDPETTETVLRALRHDAKEALTWFSAELGGAARARTRAVETDGTAPRIQAPLLCLVGERDRATELYQERHREWGAFAERVDLATIPRAGHYFLRHQPEQLAALLREKLDGWTRGDLPEPVVTEPADDSRRSLRAFFTVATGQAVSMIGNELSSFALGVWAYQRSGDIVDLALVVMLAQLPMALLTPIGGALADRVDRRRVMLACDALSGIAMAALALLMATGLLSLPTVCAIVGVTAVASAFRDPAYLAAIAQLAPKPYLPQANALAQIGVGLGRIAGPMAGGVLIALAGLTAVVSVDVVSFAVGVGTLLAVRFPDRMFVRRRETFRAAVTGGWRFLARRPPLMLMVGYFAVVNYWTAVMWVAVPPLVLSFSSPAALGTVTALGGLGAAVGAVAVVRWGGTRRRATGMIGFVVASGVGMVVMGVRPSVTLIAFGFVIRMAAMSIGNAHWLAIMQTKVGHELQGRVLATNLMLVSIMQPLGFLTAGPLANGLLAPLLAPGGALHGTLGGVVGTGQHGGVALLLILAGVFFVVWGGLGLRYRRLHRLEDGLPDATPGAELDADLDVLQGEADLSLVRQGL